MFRQAVAAPINHLLKSESWALKRLEPFAGKTAQFRVVPLSLSLTVLSNGEVAMASGDAPANVTFGLTPPLLLRIVAGDEAAYKQVEVSGDDAFASEIFYVVKNLRWDVEEDLSHVLGDILAHRVVQSGSRLMGWRAQVILSLAQTFAEYWTEEQPLLAKSTQVEKFVRDVDTLRNDMERLEKRLEKISNALPRRTRRTPSKTRKA